MASDTFISLINSVIVTVPTGALLVNSLASFLYASGLINTLFSNALYSKFSALSHPSQNTLYACKGFRFSRFCTMQKPPDGKGLVSMDKAPDVADTKYALSTMNLCLNS
eukprot:223755_1